MTIHPKERQLRGSRPLSKLQRDLQDAVKIVPPAKQALLKKKWAGIFVSSHNEIIPGLAHRHPEDAAVAAKQAREGLAEVAHAQYGGGGAASHGTASRSYAEGDG